MKSTIAETITQSTDNLEKLNSISRVCLLYQDGAEAQACMERIIKILTRGTVQSN